MLWKIEIQMFQFVYDIKIHIMATFQLQQGLYEVQNYVLFFSEHFGVNSQTQLKIV